MATSHYCHGKWRSGSVGSCPRHEKLAKKQTTVYRGVGDPGGRSGTSASEKPAPKKSEKPAPKKSEKSSGSTGASPGASGSSK